MKDNWYCRWAPSLGALESDSLSVWGTPPYEYWEHKRENLIQFGVFDLRDFLAVHFHKGRKAILWAGSDILALIYGHKGKARFIPENILLGIVQGAENWVENETEKEALESLGIKVRGVCPSFLGDVNMEVSYKWNKTMSVYASASEGREREYGFTTILNIANALPDVNFHLYGSDLWKRWYEGNPHKQKENVFMHGRIPKEQMNEETSKMQVGLRLNAFDGFSEIMAKAVLRGQYAIGKVKHPHIPSYENDLDLILELNKLRREKKPNLKVRSYYIKHLNGFPWNEKH